MSKDNRLARSASAFYIVSYGDLKNSVVSNGTRTHDADTMLYQLSYEATQLAEGQGSCTFVKGLNFTHRVEVLHRHRRVHCLAIVMISV